jgi:hypothetical protein
MSQKKTLFDKFLSRIKNNPVAATILVIGTIVIATSTFTDAAQKILAFFVGEETHNVAGKWQTLVVTNVYVESDRFKLLFEFIQQGDTLSGTLTDMDAEGSKPFTQNIADGKIKGNRVSFYTQTEVDSGKGNQPMKEAYSGILNKNKDAIAFTRLDDLPTGGVPETFVAKRK